MFIDDLWFGMIIDDWQICTLPKTNIVPENGWLEDHFPFGCLPIFRGKLAVSFREGKNHETNPPKTKHHIF